MILKISLPEARAIAIHAQWLNRDAITGNKEEVLQTVEHLGYIQIDTLSVVERAHHHALWSRVPGYQTDWLNELLMGKQIFEYWGHAASYLPMKDYRFSMIRKREYAKGKSHWFEQDKKVKRHVLQRIRREGPLQSKDFENPEEGSRNWYYWKPAKRALEQLFMEGKLMVCHRKGFQKVYDVAENVLPSSVNTRFPSRSEYAEHLVLNAVRSLGIVTDKEIYYRRGAWNEHITKALTKLARDGSILELKLEGHEHTGFYCSSEAVEIEIGHQPNAVHILSPFDNLLIQRKRLQRLFQFDYVIECYVPEHKRKFGYFTLPVMHGDQFIARMDPKADRAAGILYAKSLSFEDPSNINDEMLNAFAKKLREFAIFNGCEQIVFEKSGNRKLLQQLKKLVK